MRRIVQRKSVRSILLVLAVMAAVLAPQAPAHAAWGTQTPLNYTLAVSGGNPYQLLTYVDGNWIQWDTGGEKVRLSINHCRQSSYVIPDIKVFINGTYKGTLYGPSSGCKTHTPTYDFGSHIDTVKLTNTGSSFSYYPWTGEFIHTYHSRSGTWVNPY